MNWVLGHICAYIGQAGLGEPPEDDEMNELTQVEHVISRSWRLPTILNSYE